MRRFWLGPALVGLVACGTVQPAAPEAAPPPPPAPAEPVREPEPEPAAVPPASPAPPTAAPTNRDEFKAAPKADPTSGSSSTNGFPRADNVLGFPSPRRVLGQPSAQELRLHFLDVGQGDSTLIECPGGGRILVDGGSGIAASSSPEGARNHLREVLGDSPSVDTVIVSHPDRDHYNALPYLLEGVTVGQVQIVGAAGEYSGAFVTWLASVPANKKMRITAEKHDPKDAPSLPCPGAAIHVLSVAARGPNDNSPKNSLSMVLMVSYGDFDAVLTADATFVTERKILTWYPHWWLDVELLKIGHHGSSTTSTSPEWIEALTPDVAVVSSGFENTHGHPRSSVIERTAGSTGSTSGHAFRWYRSQHQHEDLPGYREAIYATGTSGTIVVGTNGSSYWVEKER